MHDAGCVGECGKVSITLFSPGLDLYPVRQALDARAG